MDELNLSDQYQIIGGFVLAIAVFFFCLYNLFADKKAETIDLVLSLFGWPIAAFMFGPTLLALGLMLSPFILFYFIVRRIRGR